MKWWASFCHGHETEYSREPLAGLVDRVLNMRVTPWVYLRISSLPPQHALGEMWSPQKETLSSQLNKVKAQLRVMRRLSPRTRPPWQGPMGYLKFRTGKWRVHSSSKSNRQVGGWSMTPPRMNGSALLFFQTPTFGPKPHSLALEAPVLVSFF